MNQRKVFSVYPQIGEEEKIAVMEVMETGMVTQLEQTRLFEEEINKYLGCHHTTALNSGTSALIAALLAHDVGEGDMVAVPTYTYLATANAVRAVGANPVFMDCNKDTFNVDVPLAGDKLICSPSVFGWQLEKCQEYLDAVKRSLKAIIIVDVAGMPCDLDDWNDYCEDHDIILIEDACEAFGAQYKKKKVGNHDHTVVFSFNITKPIHTIEGGAVCTNDIEIDERIKLIRRQGQDLDLVVRTGDYHHPAFGLNFRTTDIQSAIGRVQLRHIDEFMKYRNEVAEAYKNMIGECSEDNIWWQEVPMYVTRHPYFMCLMVCKTETLRDKILRHLRSKGIESRVCWKPCHLQPIYEDTPKTHWDSTWLYLHSLTLPTGNVIPKDVVDYVADSVIEALR